ncbi:MAG: dihydrolipoyl dehydrogenase [Bacteriovoracaceae bacterium]|nr:dihydrolipoyl dehydrogenase [Bacteriovoracaceae bacterium]
MSETYDLIVIGAGPGGYTAAILAAKKGLRVGIAEGSRFGGTCTNTGCIPTKTYIESASLLMKIRSAEKFGIRVENPAVDFTRVKARKDRVVTRLSKGVEYLLKHHGVDIFPCMADIEEPGIIRAQDMRLKARNTVIATGSKPKRPRLFEAGGIWTSDEVFDITELPESLAIIGAGVIGMEMAHIFSTLGVDVTLIEARERILPLEDEHVSVYMTKLLRKLSVYTSAYVSHVEGSGPYALSVDTPEGKETIDAEQVFLCIGRDPVVPDGCEKLGVLRRDSGGIVVDEHLQTTVPGVYAIGDVTGEHMYAYVASREAAVAVDHITGGSETISYRNIPSVIYTHPEIASVGISSPVDGTRASRTGMFPLSALGRARTMEAGDGYAHITASPEGMLQRISIIAPHATDLIAWAALAVDQELTVEQFLGAYCPHPTLSEILKEAAEDLLGVSVHKP